MPTAITSTAASPPVPPASDGVGLHRSLHYVSRAAAGVVATLTAVRTVSMEAWTATTPRKQRSRKRVREAGRDHGRASPIRGLEWYRPLSTERQARRSTLHLFDGQDGLLRSIRSGAVRAETSTLYRYILTNQLAPPRWTGRRGRCHIVRGISRVRHDRLPIRPQMPSKLNASRYPIAVWSEMKKVA